MIYICGNCGFLFHRVGEVVSCPSCEDQNIRTATQEEGQILHDFLTHAQTIHKGDSVL